MNANQDEMHDRIVRRLQEGGRVYQTGDLAATDVVLADVESMIRNALGAHHSELADLLDLRARISKERGDFGSARPRLEESLRIRRRMGSKHPLVAQSLLDLGQLYFQLGLADLVWEVGRESLEIHENIHGDTHPLVADSLSMMSTCHANTSETTDAERLQRALSIRLETLGAEHLDTAQSHNDLGMALFRLEERNDGRRHLERAIELRRRLAPHSHVLAQSLVNLGSLMHDERAYDDAIACFEEAIAIRRKKPVSSDARIAIPLSNLALTLVERGAEGDSTRAIACLEEALKLRLRILGEDHPRTLVSRENLAHVLLKSGGAEAALAQLEVLARHVDVTHPSGAERRLDLLRRIAELRAATQDPKGAQEALRQLLDGQLEMGEGMRVAVVSTLTRWVRSLEGDSGDRDLLILGAIALVVGDYAAAHQISLEVIHRPRCPLSDALVLCHLCVLESGGDGTQDLGDSVALDPWSKLRLRFLSGRIDGTEFLSGACDATQREQAHYHRGARARRNGHEREAAECFELAVKGDGAQSLESFLAHFERQRMLASDDSWTLSLIERLLCRLRLISIARLESHEVEEALELSALGYELSRVLLGEDHVFHTNAIIERGIVALACGHHDQAEPLLRMAIESAEVSGAHLLIPGVRLRLARCLHQQGKVREAERVLAQIELEDEDSEAEESKYELLARIRFAQFDYDGAEASYRHLVALYHASKRPITAEAIAAFIRLGEVLGIRSAHQEALEVTREAVARCGAQLPEDTQTMAAGLVALAHAEDRSGASDVAERTYLQALELLDEAGLDTVEVRGLALRKLASLYRASGRIDDAYATLEQERALLEHADAGEGDAMATCLEAISELERTLGHHQRAATLRTKAGKLRERDSGRRYHQGVERRVEDLRVASALCLKAFAEGDLQHCAELGLPMLTTDPTAFIGLAVLLSLQWLGCTGELEQACRTLLREPNTARERTLLRLALGDLEFADALDHTCVDNDGSPAQAWRVSCQLAVATSAARDGRHDEARAQLEQIRQISGNTVERQYAEALSWLLSVEPRTEPTSLRAAEDTPYAQAHLTLEIKARLTEGDYERALATAERACDLHRRAVGPTDNQYVATVQLRGIALMGLGRLREAKRDLDEVEKARRQIRGPDRWLHAETLDNLAHLHSKMGDLEGALKFSTRSVNTFDETLGPMNPRRSTALHNKGSFLVLLCRPAEAEPLLQEALDNRVETIGIDHIDTILTMAMLAELNSGLRRPERALSYTQRMLEAMRRSHQTSRPEYPSGLESLSDLYCELSQWTAAIPPLEERLSLPSCDPGGQEESDIGTRARVMDKLARLLDATGRWNDAAPLFERCARAWVSAWMSNVVGLVSSLHYFERRCHEQGCPERARALLDELGIPDIASLEAKVLPLEFIEEFAAGDFRRCGPFLAQCLGRDVMGVFPRFLPLLICCAIRGGHDAAAITTLDRARNSGLPHRLVELVMGEAALEDVLATARDEEQRTQALYYGAVRLRQEGDEVGYQEYLRRCVDDGVSCWERRLAEAELRYATAPSQMMPPDDPPNRTGVPLPPTEHWKAQIMGAIQSNALPVARVMAMAFVEMLEQISDATAEDHASALVCLALVEQQSGRATAAEELFRRAVRLIEASDGRDTMDHAVALHGLGTALVQNERHEDGVPILEQALAIKARVVGKKDESYSTSLYTLALSYKALHRVEDALRAFLKCEQIDRETCGEQSVQLATTLHSLAELCVSVGWLDQARESAVRAVQIVEKALPPCHPTRLHAQMRLATVYRHRYELDAAVRLGEEMVSNIIEQPSVDRSVDVEALTGLALTLRQRGEPARAEPLVRRAVEISTEIGPSRWLFDAVILLSGCQEDLGEYEDAQASLESALRASQGHYGRDDVRTLRAVAAYADLLIRRGRLESAGALIERAMVLSSDDVREFVVRWGSLWPSLAELWLATGNLSAAERMIDTTLQVERSRLGPRHPSLASTLVLRGDLHLSINDLVGAQRSFEEASACLTTLGDEHPRHAEIDLRQAELHARRGQVDRAIQLAEDCVNRMRTTSPSWHPRIGTALVQLGHLYERAGDLRRALKLLTQSAEIARNSVGAEHCAYGDALWYIARVHVTNEDPTVAEPLLRRSIEIERSSRGALHPRLAERVITLARISAKMGRVAEARSLAVEAIAIERKLLAEVFAMGSERQRRETLMHARANLSTFLDLTIRDLRGADAMRLAADLILERKLLGLEALLAQRDAVLGGEYPALASKLKELTSVREQIAHEMLTGPASGQGLESHAHMLRELTERREHLEVELARNIPALADTAKIGQVDRQSIARCLPEHTCLVELLRYDRWADGSAGYAGFVLHPEHPDEVQLIDLGDAGEIDELVERFRRRLMCSHRGSEAPVGQVHPGVERDTVLEDDPHALHEDIEAAGRRLAELVLEPLRPLLRSRTSVVLSPDGPLSLIPFEALPLGRGRYVIDEFQITYIACGRDILRWSGDRPAELGEAVVIAAPSYDLRAGDPEVGSPPIPPVTSCLPGHEGRRSAGFDRARLHFSPLTYTRIEGERIADLLGVVPWTGDDALERSVKELVSPSIVHFATHGFFLADQTSSMRWRISQHSGPSGMWENPLLRSGLALAGANTWIAGEPLPSRAEDGLLTAEDVTGLNLMGTELVVLSACSTGVGEIDGVEGVLGLRRSFQLAGARTVVASLWPVPDEATQVLMLDYYERLLRGEPRAEALRQAKLVLRRRAPPGVWAAFISLGYPGPLDPTAVGPIFAGTSALT